MKRTFKYRQKYRFMPVSVYLKAIPLLVLILILTVFEINAQPGTRKIFGQVLSALDNTPVVGANILIKGTLTGTTSDIDGKFQLEVPDKATLIVSFVGYLTDEVAVEGQTELTVLLTEDITSLEEVVVVGYGVQKKKLVTGATSQVKGSDLEKLSTTNALQALQGQTTGVNIMSSSGQPGEGIKVTIRGLGTIGNSGPLYIVDGVQTGDIKYLNNSDIESIDVLKDAASAAIYGSRAANGVILITTKNGKVGKSQITFDAYYGVENRPKNIEMLDAREYAIIMNEQHLNSGGNVSSLPFDVDNLPAYTSAGPANTDWLDEMFVKNAVTQNYSLGATGGNTQTIYSLSLSYTGQEGIVGGSSVSNYARFGGRLNSENLLYNGKLKVGEHLNFTYVERQGIAVGDQYNNSLRGAFNTSPLLPMYDDNGEFFNTAAKDEEGKYIYWNNTEANPYASMIISNQNRTNNQKLLGDIYAELEPVKNLRFRVSFGVDYYAEDYRSFTPIYQLSIYAFSDKTRATQSQAKSLTMNLDNTLSYSLSTGSHNAQAMIGMSARAYNGSYVYGENTDLAFDDFDHSWLSNATNEDGALKKLSGAPYDQDRLLSYFGRIQYSFNETYLLNATMRADGSSKFAEGNRWGYFPSLSVGWVLSNEAFMNAASKFVNFLKLRASWGQNGNQNISSFQYLAPIAFTQATYAFGGTEGINTTGSYPSRLAYEDLKWETSEQINIGFDSRFIDSKLAVTFDWFNKSTKDWLIVAPVLATFGTDPPYINGGRVVNKGVELGISFNSRVSELMYSIAANTTYLQNEVKDIPTGDGIIHGATNSLYNNSMEFYRAESGHPIGYFWGYETAGIFQNTGEVNSYTNSTGIVIQPDAKPGDLRYVDQDDNGEIDDDDKVEVGDPNPNFIFGLTLSADYKAFDFQVVANGVAGNQLVQSYRNHTNKYSNYSSAILDRWTGEGTSNKIPRVTNANINYQFSDIYIQNGDYLRISNITLGFDLAKVVKLKMLSQCRLYASVQNLYTFTGYDGMDAEVGYGFNNGETDQFSSGIDLGYYPSPRTILAGISVKF
jgi:TonB-dependent starch-binding outer membrane protein SusC